MWMFEQGDYGYKGAVNLSAYLGFPIMSISLLAIYQYMLAKSQETEEQTWQTGFKVM